MLYYDYYEKSLTYMLKDNRVQNVLTVYFIPTLVLWHKTYAFGHSSLLNSTRASNLPRPQKAPPSKRDSLHKYKFVIWKSLLQILLLFCILLLSPYSAFC